jgi:hypothetical protein
MVAGGRAATINLARREVGGSAIERSKIAGYTTSSMPGNCTVSPNEAAGQVDARSPLLPIESQTY